MMLLLPPIPHRPLWHLGPFLPCPEAIVHRQESLTRCKPNEGYLQGAQKSASPHSLLGRGFAFGKSGMSKMKHSELGPASEIQQATGAWPECVCELSKTLHLLIETRPHSKSWGRLANLSGPLFSTPYVTMPAGNGQYRDKRSTVWATYIVLILGSLCTPG